MDDVNLGCIAQSEKIARDTYYLSQCKVRRLVQDPFLLDCMRFHRLSRLQRRTNVSLIDGMEEDEATSLPAVLGPLDAVRQ